MTDLVESSTWTPGIRQFETSDPVEGGPDGIDNVPLRQLANRTRYLKDVQDAQAGGLEMKAPLASPAFTGSPQAPVPPQFDNSTKLATTSWVWGNVIGRNKIINGAMAVDQRQGGAAVTPGGIGGYGIDRWKLNSTQANKITIQQNTGTIAPTGFQYWFGVTVSTAYAITAADAFNLVQPIEANNLTDLNWGSPNAQPVSLQFWVFSSTPGTFAGSLVNVPVTRTYPFTYSVASANTWTKINIPNIPGDTTGSWNMSGAGSGMLVQFNLGAGSNFQGSAGTWQSGGYTAVPGAVNLLGTAGARFCITGVQLEIGAVCTQFENRSFGMELMLCQRYYEAFSGSYYLYTPSVNDPNLRLTLAYKVTKRAPPAVTVTKIATGGSTAITVDSNGVSQLGLVASGSGVSLYEAITAVTADADL
ncbi:hypothetical protein [Burkholderia ubonensis]|uniref:hypothetical protein n=1 Tax=Burkholderia ubonensis TaxID=101571 RepID=UPI00075D73E4|nr:hypothetical protein [Burkholderia ubonensis]KVO15852.1 hypothetical protein WJ72_11740 [Burkholderia ubonensis]